MRIVLFNLYGSKPNPVYEILAKELRDRGHDVIVAALNEAGDLSWNNSDKELARQDLVEKNPGKYGNIPLLFAISKRKYELSIINKVKSLLREFEPQIVQVNTTRFPNLLPLSMPRSMHFVYDIRQINEQVGPGKIKRLREQLEIQKMSIASGHVYERTFFCHKSAAERILGKQWRQRSEVIPVAVDDQFLKFESKESVLIEPGQVVQFVYVGTLSPLRNLTQLFLAAKILLDDGYSFQISLIGPDQSQGRFQREIEDLGVGSVVRVEPPVPYDQIPAVLVEHHVGLAYVPDRPTWHYQPTIKIKEYRAIGLPILSTDVASHHEFVQDGINGVLVEDTPQSVAEGMARMIGDIGFLRQCQDNARQLRSGILWEDVAEMYEMAYQRLVD